MNAFNDADRKVLETNPFTERLAKNFNSLEDILYNEMRKLPLIYLDYESDIYKDMNSNLTNHIKTIVTNRRKYMTHDCALVLSILYSYSIKCLHAANHEPFLNALFHHPQFKEHLIHPIVMRFLFTCVIHVSILEEEDLYIEPQLDTFYLAVRSAGRELYWDFLEEMAERLAIYKEDLIAAAWHPKRVEKWLEAGGIDLLEAL